MKYRYPRWKEQLTEARNRYNMETFGPAGINEMRRKGYSATNTSGLTVCVTDWLRFHNHVANHIGTTRSIVPGNHNSKMASRFPPKRTEKINAIINNTPVQIEIMPGNRRMTDTQFSEQKLIEAAGGAYLLVRNMTEFITWYLQFTTTQNN